MSEELKVTLADIVETAAAKGCFDMNSIASLIADLAPMHEWSTDAESNFIMDYTWECERTGDEWGATVYGKRLGDDYLLTWIWTREAGAEDCKLVHFDEFSSWEDFVLWIEDLATDGPSGHGNIKTKPIRWIDVGDIEDILKEKVAQK